MTRSTLARRFLPLAALLAVQLIIIAVAPSKTPSSRLVASTVGPAGRRVAGGQSGTSGGVGAGSETVDTSGATVDTGLSSGGTSSAGPSAGGSSANGPAAAASNALPPGAAATGDTTHCVDGRQFDAKVYEYAPPCIPKFTGDNGGKTTDHGVDGKTIKVDWFQGNYGQAVNAILQQTGSLATDAQLGAILQADANYINTHYELYGRKVQVKIHDLQCGTGGQGPPQNACLRNEMRQVQAQDDPYAVVWGTPVSSETFDELSQLGIVNLGGYYFRDAFNVAHRPYHWDLQMGGDQLTTHVANWWCQRMYGGGKAKAAYGGTADIQNSTRVLGVISTDDPDNIALVTGLDGKLRATCGAHIEHRYQYSQDITTANQQVQATLAKMRQPPQATSIMCFCDQVAPAFLYNGEEQQSYYPENIVVGAGFMDDDKNAQSYDHLLPPDTPSNNSRYPEFENAFGLAQYPQQQSETADAAVRVWQAAGNQGTPCGCSYKGYEGDWEYFSMLATLLEDAGPQLTPANMESGAFQAPPIAPLNNTDAHYNQRGFAPGIYTWDTNLREVYWSPGTKSDENGSFGTYKSLNGGHWYTDQWPSGLLSLPPKPR